MPCQRAPDHMGWPACDCTVIGSQPCGRLCAAGGCPSPSLTHLADMPQSGCAADGWACTPCNCGQHHLRGFGIMRSMQM